MFMSEYEPWMRHIAERSLRGSESQAEDVVAELLRKFVESNHAVLRTFGEPYNLKAWLAVLVRRAASRLRNRMKTESAYAHEIALLKTVKRPLVEKLLQRIPQGDADLLRLYYLEGLSYGAISERTGIPVNTIGKQKFRALKELRRISHLSSAF